jgi:hypothetical protein
MDKLNKKKEFVLSGRIFLVATGWFFRLDLLPAIDGHVIRAKGLVVGFQLHVLLTTGFRL